LKFFLPENTPCHKCPELRHKIKGLQEHVKYLEAREQAREEVEEFSQQSLVGNSESNNYRPLDFEFCFKLREVRKYAASKFREGGDNGEVGFNGTIDAQTGLVVCRHLGRIKEHSIFNASDGLAASNHEKQGQTFGDDT
jgi:hypothetical protein